MHESVGPGRNKIDTLTESLKQNPNAEQRNVQPFLTLEDMKNQNQMRP
jgi:hypothetical protein